MPASRDDLVAALTTEWTRLGAELVLLAQSVAERLKINITDLQCLAAVVSAGPMTAGQVAEATGLTTGAVTGVVDRLENAGLVRRESDPADRRRVVVRAVSGDVLAGRDAAVGEVLAGLTRAAAEQYEGYSDRELQLVVDAMARAHPVLLEHATALRTRPPARHELDAPLAGAPAGRLILSPGLGSISVGSDPGMTELYRAHADGAVPVVDVDGGTVRVRARRTPLFGWGHRNLQVTLNGAIPWDIEIEQGAAGLSADLRGMVLRSFAIHGGASRFDLRLGPPSGAVPVTIRGGASRVDVRRPQGVPVEIRIKGGVSGVTVDGRKFGPAAGNVAWHVPDAEQPAADRYVIEVRGGVSRLAVDPD